MSEEIKELKGIDEVPMFSYNAKTKEFYVLGHKFEGVNSVEDFINYITNLHKENENFKKRLLYEQHIQDTNKRIDKAIEYIKKESWFSYKDNEEVIDRTSTENLLNILQGDDIN